MTNNVATLYDVSPYQGVQFYARLGTKPSVNTVRFELTTYETQMAPGCTTCGDHFGVSVPLTANFVLYQEPFGALTQTGTGVPQVPSVHRSSRRPTESSLRGAKTKPSISGSTTSASTELSRANLALDNAKAAHCPAIPGKVREHLDETPERER